MPKKISDRERLLTYAMTATVDQLQDAIEIFRAVLKARTPQPRKPRPKTEKAKTADAGE